MSRTDLADKIKRQYIRADFDKKARALIMRSFLIMKDDKVNTLSSVKLNTKTLADLKASKSYHEFRDKINKKYKITDALKVTSRFKKARQIKNTEYDATTNRLADYLGLDNLTTQAQAQSRKKMLKTKVKSKAKVKVKK